MTNRAHLRLALPCRLRDALVCGASAIVIGALATGPALAQEASGSSSNMIEELVVTAEKREQSLQDVPVAVSAYTSEKRDVLGVNSVEDIARITPSVSYTNNDRMSIRGLGRLTNAIGTDPSVALYSDGIFSNSMFDSSTPSLFIERTEILRGPQGTLYGRNSIGGTINIVSKRRITCRKMRHFHPTLPSRCVAGRRLRHAETYGKCAESDTLSEHFLEKQAGIEMVEDSQETTHFGFQTVAKEQKQDMVAHVFHSVAAKYDVMNDLMSFGIHRLWKRFTIDCSGVRRGQTVLDLAGGTGDLTAKFSRLVGETGRVMLADINDSMLKMGREKLRNIGIVGNVEYVQANAEALPFADNTFDCITISFGLRNVTDKEKALRSMYRVLKPGGRLLVLEFSKPIIEPLSKAYDAYSFHILPKVGELVAKDGDSYRYLAESIRMHPDQETLKGMMQDAGFENVDYYNLTAGIVALHRGYKF